MDIDLSGFATRLTRTANVRTALLLEPEPDEAWIHLFEDANPPVTDPLLDTYVVHGVEMGEEPGDRLASTSI